MHGAPFPFFSRSAHLGEISTANFGDKIAIRNITPGVLQGVGKIQSLDPTEHFPAKALRGRGRFVPKIIGHRVDVSTKLPSRSRTDVLLLLPYSGNLIRFCQPASQQKHHASLTLRRGQSTLEHLDGPLLYISRLIQPFGVLELYPFLLEGFFPVDGACPP